MYMKKENKVRLIFWGTIWLIMVILSIVGAQLYVNGIGTYGKIRKELKPVNDSFNNLSTISRYNDAGIEIKAKLKNDKITVRYKTDTIDASYDFKYDNSIGVGTLVMQFGNNSADKDISMSVARFMIDAVAVKNGHAEGEVFKDYQFDYFYNTNVIQGLGISDEGTTTTVKINLETVITDTLKNNVPPNIIDTSTTIQRWEMQMKTTENMITVFAKTNNENYATYKTDISSIVERNKLELSWIDYESLTDIDLRYLSSNYNIININDFYTMITSYGSKIGEINGVKTIDEIEAILKKSNTES